MKSRWAGPNTYHYCLFMLSSVIRGWLARRQAGMMRRKLYEEISDVRVAVKECVTDLSFNRNDELDIEVKQIEKINGLPSKTLPVKELKVSFNVL